MHSAMTHGTQIRKSHSMPFTPRPSPLSRHLNEVDRDSIKSAVDGIVQDYPALPKLAMRLSALGREHSRKKADLVAEAVKGVPTPDRNRYLNKNLLNALYDSTSLGSLPPTPLLAAFRTPLLAKYHAKSKPRQAEDVEQSRHKAASDSERPRDGDLDFGFTGDEDIGLEDDLRLDEPPPSDLIIPSPSSTSSTRKRLRPSESPESPDEEVESGDEGDPSKTYTNELNPDTDTDEEPSPEGKKRTKKRKTKATQSTPSAAHNKIPRSTQPTQLTKSTPAQISAGKARAQKSKDIKNDCCQIFEEYTASTMEVFDELLENEDLEVEDYKVAIERLREEALEAQEAVVELRSTRYARGTRSTPKSDRLLRRGIYDDRRSQDQTPSRPGGQSSRS